MVRMEGKEKGKIILIVQQWTPSRRPPLQSHSALRSSLSSNQSPAVNELPFGVAMQACCWYWSSRNRAKCRRDPLSIYIKGRNEPAKGLHCSLNLPSPNQEFPATPARLIRSLASDSTLFLSSAYEIFTIGV